MRLVLFVGFSLFLGLALLEPSRSASVYGQAKTDITAIVPCDVSAYVIDQDPKGLNVRSGPGGTFAVIGNLPNKDTGVGVHITGSNGEWVQIDLGFEQGTEKEQTLFKGVGWVYGPLLGLTGTAQSGGGTALYQQAELKGRVIKRVPGGEDVTVHGCRAGWLFVEYKKTKGWAAPRTLCSNSLTTCV